MLNGILDIPSPCMDPISSLSSIALRPHPKRIRKLLLIPPVHIPAQLVRLDCVLLLRRGHAQVILVDWVSLLPPDQAPRIRLVWVVLRSVGRVQLIHIMMRGRPMSHIEPAREVVVVWPKHWARGARRSTIALEHAQGHSIWVGRPMSRIELAGEVGVIRPKHWSRGTRRSAIVSNMSQSQFQSKSYSTGIGSIGACGVASFCAMVSYEVSVCPDSETGSLGSRCSSPSCAR